MWQVQQHVCERLTISRATEQKTSIGPHSQRMAGRRLLLPPSCQCCKAPDNKPVPNPAAKFSPDGLLLVQQVPLVLHLLDLLGLLLLLLLDLLDLALLVTLCNASSTKKRISSSQNSQRRLPNPQIVAHLPHPPCTHTIQLKWQRWHHCIRRTPAPNSPFFSSSSSSSDTSLSTVFSTHREMG